MLALATLLGPAEAVVCTDWAHVATDETGAPERILGAKLIDLPATDGKLRPEQIDEVAGLIGNPHHVQPGVVSITQATELGTVYSPDEVGELCDRGAPPRDDRAHGRRPHRQRHRRPRRRRRHGARRSRSTPASTC